MSAGSRVAATCTVSYLDSEGSRHIVEVEAERLYEAAVPAIRTPRRHTCEPGQAARLEVPGNCPPVSCEVVLRTVIRCWLGSLFFLL